MLFSKLIHKVIRLKDGRTVKIRLATSEDNDRIWNMLLQLSERTMKFLRPEGFTRSDVDDWLLEVETGTSVIFLAEDFKNGQYFVVAVGLLHKGSYQHSHVAELSIVVRDDYQNQGLGTEITKIMINYAKSKAIKKLVLRVYADNERACHMYRKLGFEIEGVFQKEALLNGKYKTIYRMCLFL